MNHIKDSVVLSLNTSMLRNYKDVKLFFYENNFPEGPRDFFCDQVNLARGKVVTIKNNIYIPRNSLKLKFWWFYLILSIWESQIRDVILYFTCHGM